MTTPIQGERLTQLRHGKESEIVDDALTEIARLQAINAELLTALHEIVLAALTVDDGCAICGCDLPSHYDNCSVTRAEAAIAKAEGLSPSRGGQ